jgi:hypothetical protein
LGDGNPYGWSKQNHRHYERDRDKENPARCNGDIEFECGIEIRDGNYRCVVGDAGYTLMAREYEKLKLRSMDGVLRFSIASFERI